MSLNQSKPLLFALNASHIFHLFPATVINGKWQPFKKFPCGAASRRLLNCIIIKSDQMVMRLGIKCFLHSPARFSHLKEEKSHFKTHIIIRKTPFYEAYSIAYSAT